MQANSPAPCLIPRFGAETPNRMLEMWIAGRMIES
ncbi:hypothetical protein L21_0535 [Methanoculleus chikugoensis]|uniref:Uncharacterized protein n=1 Tax=Methanoculleus chikugoensis TaxID=118126 RepID=A0A1M4MIB4_9EURY|nr:hypothetical protein L21_0535 [Methanoculleus chikugoensis]